MLNVVVDSKGMANVKATDIGKSEIQLQQDGVLVKTLKVEVCDHIVVSLNPVAKKPVLK